MWWKVGLVLVMCSGLPCSEAREEYRDSSPRKAMLRAPVETLDFGFVPSVVYETHAYYEPGPIGVLFHMVHTFLYVVQPNPFPKGEMHTGTRTREVFHMLVRVFVGQFQMANVHIFLQKCVVDFRQMNNAGACSSSLVSDKGLLMACYGKPFYHLFLKPTYLW